MPVISSGGRPAPIRATRKRKAGCPDKRARPVDAGGHQRRLSSIKDFSTAVWSDRSSFSRTSGGLISHLRIFPVGPPGQVVVEPDVTTCRPRSAPASQVRALATFRAQDRLRVRGLVLCATGRGLGDPAASGCRADAGHAGALLPPPPARAHSPAPRRRAHGPGAEGLPRAGRGATAPPPDLIGYAYQLHAVTGWSSLPWLPRV